MVRQLNHYQKRANLIGWIRLLIFDNGWEGVCGYREETQGKKYRELKIQISTQNINMSEKENLDITQSSGFPVSHVENPQVDPSVHPEQNQHVVNLSENQQIVPNEQIHYINNSSIQEYMTNESNFEIKPKIQGKINQPGFTINTIIFCLFHVSICFA